MWATPDTHIEILAQVAQTTPFVHPAIPSVILTVAQVLYLQESTSGTTGTSGTSGVNGTSGTSGTSGGTGSSGASGSSGTSGTSGTTGTSGTSGTTTMAIGGTITSATAGSVLYAGASGVLAQNNANFFWDNTNTRLGIGTASPTARLNVTGSTTASSGFGLSTVINPTLVAAANGDKLIALDVTGTFTTGSFTGTSSLIARFNGNVIMGTIPSVISSFTYVPLTLSNSAFAATKVQLALVNGGGGGGAASAIDFFTYTDAGNGLPGVRIIAVDDGNYSGDYQIQTKAQGSVGAGALSTKFVIIGGSGNIGIGTTTVGSKLQVNGNAAIGYSASTAAPSNGLVVSGNIGIGTTTIGSQFQVNGNAAIGYSASTAAPTNGLVVSGNMAIGTTTITNATTDVLTISKNQNDITKLIISNTTSGTISNARLSLLSSSAAGAFEVGKFSAASTGYKIITANSGFLYNPTAGNIAILNDVAAGNIIFAAGGSSTAQLTIASTGAITATSTITSTQYNISALNTAPATATSTGTLGEIRFAAGAIYVCTATNTWVRTLLITF